MTNSAVSNGVAANSHPAHAVDIPQLFSLNGRSIIVTGATGGLGLQVVKAILQSGADVIAVDLPAVPDVANWSELKSLAAKTGSSLIYRNCNISDEKSVATAFEDAASSARYPVRGLVNCAAIGYVGDSISFDLDTARRTLDVNLLGSLITAQVAARIVKKQRYSASFVLIASMSGYIVQKGTPTAVYAASKAGVQQLTRNLASEWGAAPDMPEIRVNSVSPGVIRTPMTRTVLAVPEFERVWTEESMLKRLSEPEDYRGPVVFLLSDASSFVTASDLLCDGGYTKW